MLCIEVDGFVGTMFDADTAFLTVLAVDNGLGSRMKFEFPSYTGTSHTEVFQCSAESSLFMSFKMVHRDDDIRVGNRCSDFRSLTIFSPDFYFPVLRPFKSVGNDYLALSGNRIETVFHSTLQMVYGVGPASGIKRVTICQERFGT